MRRGARVLFSLWVVLCLFPAGCKKKKKKKHNEPPPVACVVEACDGLDNDCDGDIDEGDAAELGCAAGEACADGACVTDPCADGACVCDEASLCDGVCVDTATSPEHCGGCENPCTFPHAAATCSGSTCVMGECEAGYGDCYADAPGCETELRSLAHCGACNEPCALDGALATCASGTCEVQGCHDDRADCNSDAPDGCEPLDTMENCSECGAPCAPEHATNPSCSGGICQFDACEAGYVDCDGDATNGCEAPELNATLAWTTDLAIDGYLPTCASDARPERRLTWVAPSTGHHTLTVATDGDVPLLAIGRGGCADFDEIACAFDEAETDTAKASFAAFAGERFVLFVEGDSEAMEFTIDATTDEAGFCGDSRDNDSDAAVDCADSDCAQSVRCTMQCAPGWDDCDGNVTNGCEEPLGGADDCGACGLACAPHRGAGTCRNMTCELDWCDVDYDTCNGDGRDGCEQPLNAVAHCGGCNQRCALPNAKLTTCESYTCTVATCRSGFDNCDGYHKNGCEPLSSLENCGECNATCTADTGETVSCETRTCVVTGCSDGYKDIDGSAATGCEAVLLGEGPVDGTTNGGTNTIGLSCSGSDVPERIYWWVAPETATYTFTATSDSGLPVLGIGGISNAWQERVCDKMPPAEASMPIPKGTAIAIAVEVLGGDGDFTLNVVASEKRFCSDSIDNDGDGVMDCQDAECQGSAQCKPVGPIDPTGPTGPAPPPWSEGCPAGYDDCDDDIATRCDRLNTANNCLACDLVCAPPHGGGACVTTGCLVTACEAGYGDCNGNAWDGCERSLLTTSDCGTCGKACTLPHAVNTSCASGDCQVVECEQGWSNCDGLHTNGCEADLYSVNHCGACGQRCAPANATQYSCATGTCVVSTCATLWGNCNADAWDGCEVPLTTTQNCGACDEPCQFWNGTASCATGICARKSCNPGWGDCDPAALDCETQLTSTTDCGACAKACELPGARTTCLGGACELHYCRTGYDRCDQNATNGCESLATAENCGECGAVCNPTNVLSSTCAPYTCVIGDCANGQIDCDRSAWNGCEAIQLGSALGSWPRDAARATADVNGTCVFDGAPDWLYAWTAPADGAYVFTLAGTANLSLHVARANCGDIAFDCGSPDNNVSLSLFANAPVLLLVEGATTTDVNFTVNIAPDANQTGCPNSLAHCGACNRACDPPRAQAPTCNDGNCSFAGCEANWGNCNGLAGDGCEQDLSRSGAHCGACGNACPAQNADDTYGSCDGGTCVVLGCKPGYEDCDKNASNGCEVDLNTSAANCGDCGRSCELSDATGACSGGECYVATCDFGFKDCDDDDANGCEVSLSTIDNCGDCNVPCARPRSVMECPAGTCTWRACQEGSQDCDKNTSNGCESLNTKAYCGNCYTACDDDERCSRGTCVADCDGGTIECGGACVDPKTDPAHCGQCNKACTGTTVCSDGTCADRCSGNTTACLVDGATICVDLRYDNRHCGSCDAPACPYGSACDEGLCRSSCTDPRRFCWRGNAATCVDTRSDPYNCGGCDAACAPGQVCSNSQCVALCAQGETRCAEYPGSTREVCVDTNSSNPHCGGCNVACAGDGLELCVGGDCALQCHNGWVPCDVNGTLHCIDKQTDNDHCGSCNNACNDTTQACSGGTCATVCAAGYTPCPGENGGTVCVLTSGMVGNNDHCGGCGILCDRQQNLVCSNSQCVPNCQGDEKLCNASNGEKTCRNLRQDPHNCGTCGKDCGNLSCEEGACVAACSAPNTACTVEGRTLCVDTNTSEQFCGNCTTSCDDEFCVGGVCTPSCSLTTCGEECVSLTRVSHCGTCNTDCRDTIRNGQAACVDGNCTLGAGGCSIGFGDCDTNPKNGCEPVSTRRNCGTCGNDCSRLEHVSDSHCEECASCSGGYACEIDACTDGYSSCDQNDSNGCETWVRPDGPGPCGPSCTLCDLANASETCASGSCAFVSCDSNWLNCDGNAANGCERARAGGYECGCTPCSIATAATARCNTATRTCEVETCADGRHNCDGNDANGCEAVRLAASSLPAHYEVALEAGSTSFQGACGGAGTAEMRLAWQAPAEGNYTVTISDGILYAGAVGCGNADLFECNASRSLTLTAAKSQFLFLVIDNASGTVNIDISAVALPCNGAEGQCSDCGDATDNDSDGLKDCDDPGCESAVGCTAGCPEVDLARLLLSRYSATRDWENASGARAYSGMLNGASGSYSNCAGGAGNSSELTFILDLDQLLPIAGGGDAPDVNTNAAWRFALEGHGLKPVVSVLRHASGGAACAGSVLACGQSGNSGATSSASLTLAWGDRIVVVADADGTPSQGDFTLTVGVSETTCDDGVDNDGDELLDCQDDDCVADDACDESKCGDGAAACCSDGTSNDGDSLIDCADQNCVAAGVCTETDCTDGEDNDGDGAEDCGDCDCSRSAVYGQGEANSNMSNCSLQVGCNLTMQAYGGLRFGHSYAVEVNYTAPVPGGLQITPSNLGVVTLSFGDGQTAQTGTYTLFTDDWCGNPNGCCKYYGLSYQSSTVAHHTYCLAGCSGLTDCEVKSQQPGDAFDLLWPSGNALHAVTGTFAYASEAFTISDAGSGGGYRFRLRDLNNGAIYQTTLYENWPPNLDIDVELETGELVKIRTAASAPAGSANCNVTCNDPRGACTNSGLQALIAAGDVVLDACDSPAQCQKLDTTAHCGSCANACKTNAAWDATCVDTANGYKCDYDCDDATQGTCNADICTANLRQTQQCGACGYDCAAYAPPHAQAASCTPQGQCVFRCDSSYADCSNHYGTLGTDCRDTRQDPNCGSCGNDCNNGFSCVPANGAASYCYSSTVVDGHGDCTRNDRRGDRETDIRSDTRHCKGCDNDCTKTLNDPEAVCVNSQCRPGCDDDEKRCNGECTPVANNNDHCGACGKPCKPDETCADKTCEFSCPSGQATCDKRTCKLLDTNASVCGASPLAFEKTVAADRSDPWDRSIKGYTEQYGWVTLAETACPPSSYYGSPDPYPCTGIANKPLGATLYLVSPPGAEYDLKVNCNNCGLKDGSGNFVWRASGTATLPEGVGDPSRTKVVLLAASDNWKNVFMGYYCQAPNGVTVDYCCPEKSPDGKQEPTCSWLGCGDAGWPCGSWKQRYRAQDSAQDVTFQVQVIWKSGGNCKQPWELVIVPDHASHPPNATQQLINCVP